MLIIRNCLINCIIIFSIIVKKIQYGCRVILKLLIDVCDNYLLDTVKLKYN